MKVRVIQSGLFRLDGNKQVEAPVGSEIEISGETLPAYMVGKVELIAKGQRVQNKSKAA